MKIRIDAVGKLQKTKKNNAEYTGIKGPTGDWINLMGDHTKLQKGVEIEITDPKTLGSGTSLWAYLKEEKKPEAAPPAKDQVPTQTGPGPTPWVDPNRKTFSEYEAFVKRAAALASQVLPGQDDQAIAAIIDTGVIAFLNGKIVLDEPEPDQDDVPF